MFAISGRRPQDNLFLLNGIEYTGASLINVTPGGTSGQLLGVDAVREFNVVSDTYSRDLWQAAGSAGLDCDGESAQISCMDRRMSFFAIRRSMRGITLTRRKHSRSSSATTSALRWAGRSGKNKLFLFGNYEGYRQNLGSPM